ncbi:hypothetical protein Bbelb_320070 [Branchiostoma belcheri]|nr:hypothetical protein Bbelb_320070 [Branchiostoma belcheri]
MPPPPTAGTSVRVFGPCPIFAGCQAAADTPVRFSCPSPIFAGCLAAASTPVRVFGPCPIFAGCQAAADTRLSCPAPIFAGCLPTLARRLPLTPYPDTPVRLSCPSPIFAGCLTAAGTPAAADTRLSCPSTIFAGYHWEGPGVEKGRGGSVTLTRSGALTGWLLGGDGVAVEVGNFPSPPCRAVVDDAPAGPVDRAERGLSAASDVLTAGWLCMTVREGSASKTDDHPNDFVFLLGEPGVTEGVSDVEVNQAQTEGQERGEAPEMNAPMPPGQVETGAETSDESDEFDFYSALRQARADRVVEFSRRNQEISPSDRAWAAVDPDDDYLYRPKDFIPPGSVGLKGRKDKLRELPFFLEIFDRACIAYVVRCTNKYAWERRRARPTERRSRWKPTSSTELKAFFATFTIHQKGPSGSQRLKAFKARERLDRGMKVRKVMERVNENSRSARHVGENLVVDEAMPDGYILADEVSGARSDPEDMPAYQRAMYGVGDDQISPLYLTPARIVHRLTLPFQGRYRTVFCDSSYTGAQLADHLFAKDTYLVGTVRRNASTLPTLRHPIPSHPIPTQSFRDPFPKQNWKAYTTERSAKKLPAHKTAQLRFRRALVRQLVGNFSARRRAPARNPPVVNPGTGPVIGEHEQVRRGKPTRACRYCAKARRLMPGARRPRPHETIYECNTCNVSVCRVSFFRVSLRPECWRKHLEEMRTVT